MAHILMKPLLTAAPITGAAALLVVGIGVGSVWQPPVSALWGAAIGVAAALGLHPHSWGRRLVFAFALLCAGAWLWQIEQNRFNEVFPPMPTTVSAVVAGEPEDRDHSVYVDLILASDGRRIVGILEPTERALALTPGTGIRLKALPQPLQTWRAGHFELRQSRIVQGYSGLCRAEDEQWKLAEVSHNGLSVWQKLQITCLSLRHSLLQRYWQRRLPEEVYAVMAAMTLGHKGELSDELRQTYAMSGASHVLALSGLHLGIVCGLITLLVRGRRLWATQIGLISAIWAFAWLVGMPISVVRSALMITLGTLFSLAGRHAFSLGNLSVAAAVILALSPRALYDVSFQLSFLSLAGIILLLPLTQKLAPQAIANRRRAMQLWQVIGLSVAAQLATSPVVAYCFGLLPTYFLVTNLVVMPAATLIVYGSLLSLIVPAASMLMIPLVETLNSTLTSIANWPASTIETPHFTLPLVVLCYCIEAALYFIVCRHSHIRILTPR